MKWNSAKVPSQYRWLTDHVKQAFSFLIWAHNKLMYCTYIMIILKPSAVKWNVFANENKNSVRQNHMYHRLRVRITDVHVDREKLW